MKVIRTIICFVALLISGNVCLANDHKGIFVEFNMAWGRNHFYDIPDFNQSYMLFIPRAGYNINPTIAVGAVAKISKIKHIPNYSDFDYYNKYGGYVEYTFLGNVDSVSL